MTGATMAAMRERVLTPAQVEALRVLGALDHADNGAVSDAAAGTVHPKAARSLVVAGLAAHRIHFGDTIIDRWQITDAGRAVLERVEEALRRVRPDQ